MKHSEQPGCDSYKNDTDTRAALVFPSKDGSALVTFQVYSVVDEDYMILTHLTCSAWVAHDLAAGWCSIETPAPTEVRP